MKLLLRLITISNPIKTSLHILLADVSQTYSVFSVEIVQLEKGNNSVTYSIFVIKFMGKIIFVSESILEQSQLRAAKETADGINSSYKIKQTKRRLASDVTMTLQLK